MKEDNFKVSVILTSYNDEKFIKQSIESVLNQTFTDFELIIWDDASNDNSWEIIKSFKDKRIKSFRNKTTKRGIWGINKAINEIAKGEYIAIHHSDDLWESTKLENQVNFLDSYPDIGAVFTNAFIIDEKDEIITDKNHPYYSIFDQPNRTRHEWLSYFFYNGNALCHPSVLIRKECYKNCGNYRFGFSQLGDYDMWIRVCLSYEIFILKEKLVRFRIKNNNKNTSSDTYENLIRNSIEYFYIMKNFLKIDNYPDMIKIFPEAIKYCNPDNFIPEFTLAMIAIEHNPRKEAKLFGMMLLYDLVNNQKKAIEIKEIYNFDYLKLIDYSSKFDIFGINKNKKYFIQLFYDFGNGYSEKYSEKISLSSGAKIQKFEFNFNNLNSNIIKKLRVDPLNDACIIRIKSIKICKKDQIIDLLPYIRTNACITDGNLFIFDSEDPQIEFQGYDYNNLLDSKIKFEIVIEYLYFGRDALNICIKLLKNKILRK